MRNLICIVVVLYASSIFAQCPPGSLYCPTPAPELPQHFSVLNIEPTATVYRRAPVQTLIRRSQDRRLTVRSSASSCSGLMSSGCSGQTIKSGCSGQAIRSSCSGARTSASCGGQSIRSANCGGQSFQAAPICNCGCGQAGCNCGKEPQSIQPPMKVSSNEYQIALRSAQYRAANGIKGHTAIESGRTSGVGWASHNSMPVTSIGRGGNNYAVVRGRDGWYSTKVQ